MVVSAGRTTGRWCRPAEPPARSDTPPIPCAPGKSKTPIGGQFAPSCPHRTSPLPYPPPPPPCAAHLACGPLNNMTPAVATDRLVCAPPCVHRLAYVWGGGGGCVGTARWSQPAESAGRTTGRWFSRPTPPPSRTTAEGTTGSFRLAVMLCCH